MSQPVWPIILICSDGNAVLQLASSLVEQIKVGGSRYNVVSATEALVSNMASEAAHTLWKEYIQKTRRAGLHPSQITGRKHLRTITREIEGISNSVLVELEIFCGKLFPSEPAAVATVIWESNMANFMIDVKLAHEKRANNMARYTVWTERLNTLVTDLIVQVTGAIGQFVKFARFSTSLILMSNYYIWKRSMNMLWNMSMGGA
jgi:phage gp37-like protein